MAIVQSVSPLQHARLLAGPASIPWSVPRVSLWDFIAFYFWIAFCVCSRLKYAYLPYVELSIGALLLLRLHRFWRLDRPIWVLLLIAAVVVSGIIGDSTVHSAVWATKLIIIFLLLSTLRRAMTFGKMTHLALLLSLVANTLLILAAEGGIEAAYGEISADGRRGTLLTNPGGLSIVGLSLLFFLSYRLICDAKHRFANIVLIGCCLLCVWRDGARTGYLTVLLVPCALVMVLAYEKRIARLWPIAIGIVLTLMLVPTTFEVDVDNPLNRLKLLSDYTNARELFESMDSTRYELLENAVRQIQLHPIIGNGFNGSVLELASKQSEHGIIRYTQVVHNAYLQIWADMGIAGLVGFCGIVLAWIPQLPRYLSRIRTNSNPAERAYYYNACFLLFCVSLFYIFHPISTECSDWVRFGASSAALAELGIMSRAPARSVPGNCALA